MISREDENTMPVVFFDIGDTLGAPRLSTPPYRLEGLDVYPYVPDVLQHLKDNHVQLGIISNTGSETADAVNKVLKEAGIFDLFESNLLIYSSVVGLKKDSPEIFRLAAERASYSANPERCLFVGEDSQERSYAIAAGWRVAPHPLLAWVVLNGSSLRYIRVTVPLEHSEQEWRSVIRSLPVSLPVVPLYVTGEGGTQVYAIATETVVLSLGALGFAVEQFCDIEIDSQATDLYLLRDDRQTRTGFLNPEGQSADVFAGDEDSFRILTFSVEGLFGALSSGRSVEDYHFEEAYHGHRLKLLPDMSLLEPFGEGKNARTASFLRLPAVEPSLSDAELEKLSQITPDAIREHSERYIGAKPLDASGTVKIKSRHIDSPDMSLVTEALARDLQEIGDGHLTVTIRPFVYRGRNLDNVEAELTGTESDEIVLVTAHLDSTINRTAPPYNPETDPAPGADDDASGVAAVLAIAKIFQQMAGAKPPKRTIRFVLFNAEEQGLVGSQAYARTQAALAAPIVAVYQMDMIGYNVKAPRSFEVHAGYRSSDDVQNRSLSLAQRLDKLVKQVSPALEFPQIYTHRDPADGRSDHASFQQRGYAACASSEDMFVGPQPDSPEAEPNPNYHKETDTFIDFDYAADIARAVAAAAWVTANL
jgi:hypothetical protein